MKKYGPKNCFVQFVSPEAPLGLADVTGWLLTGFNGKDMKGKAINEVTGLVKDANRPLTMSFEQMTDEQEIALLEGALNDKNLQLMDEQNKFLSQQDKESPEAQQIKKSIAAIEAEQKETRAKIKKKKFAADTDTEVNDATDFTEPVSPPTSPKNTQPNSPGSPGRQSALLKQGEQVFSSLSDQGGRIVRREVLVDAYSSNTVGDKHNLVNLKKEFTMDEWIAFLKAGSNAAGRGSVTVGSGQRGAYDHDKSDKWLNDLYNSVRADSALLRKRVRTLLQETEEAFAKLVKCADDEERKNLNSWMDIRTTSSNKDFVQLATTNSENDATKQRIEELSRDADQSKKTHEAAVIDLKIEHEEAMIGLKRNTEEMKKQERLEGKQEGIKFGDDRSQEAVRGMAYRYGYTPTWPSAKPGDNPAALDAQVVILTAIGQIEKLESELTDAKAEVKQIKAAALESNMKTTVDSAKSESMAQEGTKALRLELAEKEKEMKELQLQHTREITQIKNLGEQLTVTEKEKRELQSELAEASLKLHAHVTSSEVEQVEELEHELNSARKMYTSLTARAAESEKQVVELKEKLSQQDKKLSVLKDSKNGEVSSEMAGVLKTHMDALDEKNKEIVKAKEEMAYVLVELKKNEESYKHDSEKSTTRIDDLEKSIQMKNATLRDTFQRISLLEEETKVKPFDEGVFFEGEIRTLAQKNADLKGEISMEAMKTQKAELEVKKLEMQVANLRECQKTLMAEKENWEKLQTVTSISNTSSSSTTESNTAQTDVATKTNVGTFKLDTEMGAVDILASQVTDLADMNDTLRIDMSELQKVHVSENLKLITVTRDMEKLKAKHEEATRLNQKWAAYKNGTEEERLSEIALLKQELDTVKSRAIDLSNRGEAYYKMAEIKHQDDVEVYKNIIKEYDAKHEEEVKEHKKQLYEVQTEMIHQKKQFESQLSESVGLYKEKARTEVWSDLQQELETREQQMRKEAEVMIATSQIHVKRIESRLTEMQKQVDTVQTDCDAKMEKNKAEYESKTEKAVNAQLQANYDKEEALRKLKLAEKELRWEKNMVVDVHSPPGSPHMGPVKIKDIVWEGLNGSEITAELSLGPLRRSSIH